MRLIIISQDFPPETGGIQTYSYQIAQRLAAMCTKLTVFAPDKPGAQTVDNTIDAEVRRINVPNTLLFLPLMYLLSVFARKQKTEVVFHSQWQTVIPSILAKKAGSIQKIAIAAHARELLFNPFKHTLLASMYKRYQKYVLSKGDMFFPVSDYTAALLRDKGVPADKINVVINGTDPEQFKPIDVNDMKQQLGLEKKKIILTVTRLVSRKGIDTVIKAMPAVLTKVPEAHYVIAGEGEDEEKLKQLAGQYNLTGSVSFMGRVAYDKLINIYNMCDVFVMPSKTTPPDVEGFGIVFLEANACGKPVIGTNSGGIPSAIINNKTGLIVHEENISELSKAITNLLIDRQKAKELGKKGRQRVLDEANWNSTTTKLFNHLQNAIHENYEL